MTVQTSRQCVTHYSRSMLHVFLEKHASCISRVTCHTLHNPVRHETQEMYETSLLSDVSHIAQSCVTRHSGYAQTSFPSNVSHIAQSCVTRHSGNDRNIFIEWRATHSTNMCGTSRKERSMIPHNPVWHVTQETYETMLSKVTHIAQSGVTRHSENDRGRFLEWRDTPDCAMCDTSLWKWTKQVYWVTCRTLHNAVWHVTQKNVRNPFLEWRVTQDCAMCDTTLWRSVFYQCVARHSRKDFRAFPEWRVTHACAKWTHLIRPTIWRYVFNH